MLICDIKLLIFLILILMLLLLMFLILKPIDKEDFEDICKSKLTDREYLEHMIQHHQIAIDMSKVLKKKTKWLNYKKNLEK